jgi:NAD(P)H-nitrite reductase large subunit
MEHVIIGNGGAGISAMQEIRQQDPDAKITIISREDHPAYSPCSLPDLLSGGLDKSKIYRFDDKFYDENNVTFLRNTKVVQVNPDDRSVKLEDGGDVKYDRLLIATGASPIIPGGMDGLDLEGVHVMGTLDSTLGMVDHIERGAKNVIVIGGGFMGIETAITLKERGLDVTVIELLPDILSRMLDPDMAVKVVEQLEKNGVKVKVNAKLVGIVGDRKVKGITLENGTLDCDMVVMAIGVKPNLDPTDGSGLDVNNGIIVDRSMKTSCPDIYAAGDVAEVTERVTGQQGTYAIWPNAIEQGQVAGSNMLSNPVQYDGADVVNVLDVFDTAVVTMGAISGGLDKPETITRSTPYYYKKLLLKEHKIVGLQFFNSVKNTGPIYSLMKKGEDISDIEDRILEDTFVFAPE